MRIAIIEQPLSALDRIKRIIRMVKGSYIAWDATTVDEAIEKATADQPDLIIISLSMQDMPVPKAIKLLRVRSQAPVLLLDPEVGGKHQKVFECMGAGAVDVVSITPRMSDADSKNELEKKLLIMARLVQSTIHASHPAGKIPVLHNTSNILVAIGCSTGGPAALSVILSDIPANINASFIVVQHLDQKFSKGFVEWLDDHSVLPVRSAKEGDKPKRGVVLIAGQDDHLVFKNGNHLGYSADPINNPYRPSVNELFESIVKHWQGKCVGVLLTGMGKDGGTGLLSMKKNSFHTIAEDQSSCVVYGMPKAAIGLNAAMEILPLQRVTSGIINFVEKS